MGLPQIGNIYFITAIAVIGGGLFGFDISSMSAIIGTQQYRCFFNQGGVNDEGQCAGPNASVQGGITASMPGGSFCGALTSGFLSDIFGRKRTIQIGALIWCVGSAITSASQNIGMLVAGRFINGVSEVFPYCLSTCFPPFVPSPMSRNPCFPSSLKLDR
jgi:MFS family permease